jgi:hypothetical protein
MGKLEEITTNGDMRHKVEVILSELKANKYKPELMECLRSLERQKQLVAEGKSKTLKSNHLAGKDGCSRACDIVDSDKHWDASRAFWLTLGRLALLHGLEWGGTWIGKTKTPANLAKRQVLREFLTDQTKPWNPDAYTGPIGWDPAHVEQA